MGYALPPGTVVSTQAWSMHRAEDVFPSAETFLPERWLVDESADGEAEDERLARYAFTSTVHVTLRLVADEETTQDAPAPDALWRGRADVRGPEPRAAHVARRARRRRALV